MLRRIIKLGGSYYVSLPKGWVEGLRLKPGDYVEVEVKEGASVEIRPHEVRRREEERAPYRVFEGPWLERGILYAYLSGYEVIEVRFRGGRRSVVERVERLQRLLIGLEVVEESEDRLVLQCFTRPGYSLESLLYRMDGISREMYVDAARALARGDETLAESVVARDDRLDRLYFLVVREIRTRMLNPEVMGAERVKLMDFRLLARDVEEIGDLSESIARLALEGIRAPSAVERVAESLSRVQGALVRRIIEGRGAAYELVDEVDSVVRQVRVQLGEHRALAVLVARIADKLRDIADLAPCA